jgi:hypothetical protein
MGGDRSHYETATVKIDDEPVGARIGSRDPFCACAASGYRPRFNVRLSGIRSHQRFMRCA